MVPVASSIVGSVSPPNVVIETTVLSGGAVCTTLTGEHPGPTVALLGGVHGDEDEGVLAVQLVLRHLTTGRLAGMVRAVAPANPLAWAAGTRTSGLDGQNLARCFPGDPHAGPTAALAAGLTAGVIDSADLLLDLHSAGVAYRMPLFTGYVTSTRAAEASARAARVFGAPLVWAHPSAAPGRTLTVAAERGTPAIYVECGGGGGIQREHLDAYVTGVLAVLADQGMLPDHPVPGHLPTTRLVYGPGDLDAGATASAPGWFVAATSPGSVVTTGSEIGTVYDLQGQVASRVTAPGDGLVMFLRQHARVHAGEVLYTLASLTPP